MKRWMVWCAISALAALGCGAEDEGGGDMAVAAAGGAGGATGGMGGGGSGGMLVGTGGAAGVAGMMQTGGAGGMSGGAGGMLSGGSGGVGGATGGVGGDGTGGMVMTGGMGGSGGAPSFDGPEDGDPTKPVVELAEPACGGASGGFGSSNFTLGGRDMIVSYPCGLHEGARLTFILNLHGTSEPNIHFYQHGYFSAHTLIDSHNLIVITPSAIATQWGREDDGQDIPHLLEIIDWVYTSFGDKVSITSLWIAGHSWGAFFAKTFVCNDMIADKARGVVAQAGGGNLPACIDRVSHIHTIGENDMGGVLPEQSSAASAKGCDAMITGPEMVGNNRHRYFANCDPGWVYSDYFMLGKGHIDSIDAEVVLSIVEEIKATEVPR